VTKVRTAAELAALIKDGDTVATCGLGMAGMCEEMMAAVEGSFRHNGHPRDLTVLQASPQGDWTPKRGPTHFGFAGLTKRWIGSHVASNPNICQLVENNQIEAYNLPQGVLVQLWRETAAHRPGILTKVGLYTYIDPRLEGGKLNGLTRAGEDLVKVVNFEGEEYLFYKSIPIDVALIRGTTADENGNLSMEREGQLAGAIHLAQAAKNSGGLVIAQIEHLALSGSLHPKDVRVPGILVDYLVLSTDRENHYQTEGTYYNPSFAGNLKAPLSQVIPLPLNERKIIARRAAMELRRGAVINLGIGMPTDIANILVEEGVSDYPVPTTETGGIGGVPASLPDFGHSWNAEALVEMPTQFDYYAGGGLDATFLGCGEVDQHGNVNVSQFGSRIVGCGGFVDISQNAHKIVFMGSLTAGGLTIEAKNNCLAILSEGRHKKFRAQVAHISYSGRFAAETRQDVLYVTERAVFTLTDGRLTLIEIAPGMELARDILANMDFRPDIAPDLREMPPGIFRPVWGELKSVLDLRRNGVNKILPGSEGL
jgi:propionate CoA-transferase